MSLSIKKGDTVVVYNRVKGSDGKRKSKKGKVLSVSLENETVIVEGQNLVSKHKKPRKQGDQGGIIEVPAPIHVSNVMLVCPSCGKPTRTGNKLIEEDGKKIKVRVCKQKGCNAIIKTVDETK